MHAFLPFLTILGYGLTIITANIHPTAIHDSHAFLVISPCENYTNTTACSTSSAVYELVDSYNASNFWDKFNFFSGTDPTNGFVHYQNRTAAEAQGLISTTVTPFHSSAVLRVDHTTTISGNDLTGQGRASVRIESVKSYAEGLIIADFSHLPAARCGVWPAFWTYATGQPWPVGGEIDIYEQWNTYPFNRQTLHMNATVAGDCSLAVSHNTLAPVMTNWNYTDNCDTILPANTGCSTWDFQAPYASPHGGIYALELAPAANTLKLWSWHHDDQPPDLVHHPDPASWGPPGLLAGGQDGGGGGCNITRTFANQTIVFDITLCGDAAGSPAEWVSGGCAAATGFNTCERYVAARGEDFEGVWFGVGEIRVYQLRK